MTAVTPSHLEALDRITSDTIRRVRTWSPANVVAFQPATPSTIATVTVQIARRVADLEGRSSDIPPIKGIPVMWPGGGPFLTWTDLDPGDDVALLIPHRSIRAWLRSGAPYDPRDSSLMDPAQAVAVPTRLTRSRGGVPANGDLCIGLADGRALIRVSRTGQAINLDALASIVAGADLAAVPLAKASTLVTAINAAMDAAAAADPTFATAVGAFKTALSASLGLGAFSTTKLRGE